MSSTSYFVYHSFLKSNNASYAGGASPVRELWSWFFAKITANFYPRYVSILLYKKLCKYLNWDISCSLSILRRNFMWSFIYASGKKLNYEYNKHVILESWILLVLHQKGLPHSWKFLESPVKREKRFLVENSQKITGSLSWLIFFKPRLFNSYLSCAANKLTSNPFGTEKF